MIRDFSNSAKKKLLEYVKDATETTLWREKSVTELGMLGCKSNTGLVH